MKGYIEVHKLEYENKESDVYCVSIIPVNRIVEVYEHKGLAHINTHEDGEVGDCVAESYEEIKKLIEEARND